MNASRPEDEDTKPKRLRDFMFAGAKNHVIYGGSFTTNVVNARSPSPLEALYKRVAPNAILNAGGRADEVRCYPGTREEVIARIEKWRDARDIQAPPIFWLSEPAGAGKTAVVQTIAERCKERGEPQANFFFFRTDSTRNSLSPLVSTLVHQIILLYPALRYSMETVLSTNPLLLDASIEDQLTQLIVIPLQTIQLQSSSYIPLLLTIDGLDECESAERRSQGQILGAFDRVMAIQPCPFRLLVASRDESHIRSAFNTISSQCASLYLSDQYSPENDIRLLVNSEFQKIRVVHPLACMLDRNWPSMEDVELIVKKSSGQFVYAAEVMHFIATQCHVPSLSLERVKDIVPVSARSAPFPRQDSMYQYILSQVENQEALRDILHAYLLMEDYKRNDPNIGNDPVDLLQVYNLKYTIAMVRSCLSNLTSIIRYDSAGHCLLSDHASFPDFLLDKTRSGFYHVDLEEFNFKIQAAVWKNLHWRQFAMIAYTGLCRLRKLPPGFLDMLNTLEPSKFTEVADGGRVSLTDIFQRIYNLCAGKSDVKIYKQILRRWISWATRNKIPLDEADHLPGAQRHSWGDHIKNWFYN